MKEFDLNSNIIIICNDFDAIKEDLHIKVEDSIVKEFCKDDFLLEDAKLVTKEAYIKESKKKYIIICAKSFNIYAQNSLLKILEESPSNTMFIIISNSKSNFLPTIKSRLKIVNLQDDKTRKEVGLDLNKMGLNDIFLFIKEHKRVSKSELKEILQNILYEAIHKYDINLKDKELSVFENALQLAELNSRADFLLSSVLLTIYNRDEKQN